MLREELLLLPRQDLAAHNEVIAQQDVVDGDLAGLLVMYTYSAFTDKLSAWLEEVL